MTWDEIQKSRRPAQPEEAKEEEEKKSKRSDSFSSDDIDALLDGRSPPKPQKLDLPSKDDLFDPPTSELETKILSTLLPNLAELGAAPLPKLVEIEKPTETASTFAYNSDLCKNNQDEEACELQDGTSSLSVEIKGEEDGGTAEKIEKFSMDFEVDESDGITGLTDRLADLGLKDKL